LQQLIRSLVVCRPRPREDGQGLAEYALILGLIAIVAILSLIFLGDSLADLMTMIGSNIDAAT
jgi:Flp pilus assembly pilin Flp